MIDPEARERILDYAGRLGHATALLEAVSRDCGAGEFMLREIRTWLAAEEKKRDELSATNRERLVPRV